MMKMNKIRRQKLQKIIEDLIKSKNELENVMDDEQLSFDNLSEGLHATMRGSAMEEAIDNLDSAMDSINEAIDYISDAQM
nr:MAG TPA: Pe family protein [Caudoviricetes sp.]